MRLLQEFRRSLLDVFWLICLGIFWLICSFAIMLFFINLLERGPVNPGIGFMLFFVSMGAGIVGLSLLYGSLKYHAMKLRNEEYQRMLESQVRQRALENEARQRAREERRPILSDLFAQNGLDSLIHAINEPQEIIDIIGPVKNWDNSIAVNTIVRCLMKYLYQEEYQDYCENILCKILQHKAMLIDIALLEQLQLFEDDKYWDDWHARGVCLGSDANSNCQCGGAGYVVVKSFKTIRETARIEITRRSQVSQNS